MGENEFTGVVIQIIGNRVRFRTRSAVVYDAETATAKLFRKNGSAMQFGEIRLGDRVRIVGKVWPDNSLNVSELRNLSLFTHRSTFRGKIIKLDWQLPGFVLQSGATDERRVFTNPGTTYTKNGQAAVMQDLAVGMRVQVKASWDRPDGHLEASLVEMKVRLVKIEFTGELVIRDSFALTVTSKGVIYAVDITQARLLDKAGRPIQAGQLTVGGQVKVVGRHLPESTKVVAEQVRDVTSIKQ